MCTSHAGVCRQMNGYIFCLACNLIHRTARHHAFLQFFMLNLSFCCKTMRTSQDYTKVWCVCRFYGEGLWLTVPIFVGDLGHFVPFLKLRWTDFSNEIHGYENPRPEQNVEDELSIWITNTVARRRNMWSGLLRLVFAYRNWFVTIFNDCVSLVWIHFSILEY